MKEHAEPSSAQHPAPSAAASPDYAAQIEALREPALRFALRMLGDRHDAEEAVQETFLRLLQAEGRFRGESSFRTYVFAAVRNACLDKMRRRVSASGQRREVNPATTAFFSNLTPGSRFQGVATQLERKEAQEIVRAALDSLTERQRTCVVLHDLEGFRYREVAEMLGLTVSHVGVVLFHARAALKKLIEEGGFLDGD